MILAPTLRLFTQAEEVPQTGIGAMTWREFFDRKYKPYKVSRKMIGATTVSEYNSLFNLVDLWCEHRCQTVPRISELSDETVDDFLSWLASEAPPRGKIPKLGGRRGRSAGTVARRQRELIALWNYARKPRHWKASETGKPPEPDLDRIQVEKKEPVAWTVEEIGQMLAAVNSAALMDRGRICGLPAAAWWRALLLTLYDSGGRLNAIMLAKMADYDPDRRLLQLQAENQKQKADQIFELSEQTAKALGAILTIPRERLFPWPYDKHDRAWAALLRRMRKLLKAAGLPSTVQEVDKPFHRFRKSSASYIAAAEGVEAAQRHAGHSTAAVTTGAYIDKRIAGGTSTADSLPRPNDVIDRQLKLF